MNLTSGDLAKIRRIIQEELDRPPPTPCARGLVHTPPIITAEDFDVEIEKIDVHSIAIADAAKSEARA